MKNKKTKKPLKAKTKPKKATASGDKRKKIRAAHWKRQITMKQEKFDVLARWILKLLGTKPIRWGDLVDRVAAKVKNFEGSIPHAVIPVIRELESQGRVKRHQGPPALYSKKK